ncbi:MAG: DUF4878 domain-containing protein [Prevotellaceae bacterium]|jgi:hypothetical protein|nr:DUF4878 domain-containing protein [Prevotellaceae bacterium]
MKKVIKLMAVLSACWLITACGTKSSPSEIVKTALTAFIKMDFETVKKHLAENRISHFDERVKSLLEDSEQKAEFMLITKDATFEFISEAISDDGNSATVIVKAKFMKNGKPEEDIDEMNLIMVEGKWKIDSNPL